MSKIGILVILIVVIGIVREMPQDDYLKNNIVRIL